MKSVLLCLLMAPPYLLVLCKLVWVDKDGNDLHPTATTAAASCQTARLL